MTTSLTQHICVCVNYKTHQSIPLDTKGKGGKGEGGNQDIRDFSLHNIDIFCTSYGKMMKPDIQSRYHTDKTLFSYQSRTPQHQFSR